MADSARARRLAKRIVAIVATVIQHQVKDPRLAMVTITAATVTPDLREATVFYTVYGDDDDVQGTTMALSSATGVLRSAVGQQTGIKFTPTLVFKLDTIPENAYRINELLAAARSADAEVAERAAGAKYAGDPDPYRVPRSIDDTDQDDTDQDDTDQDDTDQDDTDQDDADDDGRYPEDRVADAGDHAAAVDVGLEPEHRDVAGDAVGAAGSTGIGASSERDQVADPVAPADQQVR